ncbi:uncharacterized protein FIBRA_07441 [Fibroporia radiculosa]|uniref:FAD/NAD(P)-binding domain-containing protein n=1 Tax=Fibroporia radiculosa TaxID=599839 RepID=J4IBT7_9APHY|nr:uncharacterized protein FIBRA_07441 [Fibroporia radiculosa]CCM05231.1 predicted protein [Fibroporia radiculosa]
MSTSDLDPLSIANEWLQRLSIAGESKDVQAFVDLFVPNGWLRDFLCFSWDFRSLADHSKIAAYLSEKVENGTRFSEAGLHDIKLETTSTLGGPSVFPLPLDPTSNGVQATFEFSLLSPPRRGRGFVRLVHGPDAQWRAFTLFTSLEDIKGHEEPRGRPLGIYPELATWEEVRAANASTIESDPTVLVVGGGQTGLQCAARLGRLGIRALVVDKNARIGDPWRNRYSSLTLHNSAIYCAFAYQQWPDTYPQYIPKEKVADFVEAYAIFQELTIWTSSIVLPTPTYDPITKRWTVTIERKGEEITLTPKHIIMCTGTTGKPYVPEMRDVNKFKGIIYHSDRHDSGAQLKGKRVVVVGACNAGHDICADAVAKGAQSVTMLQRSATCVASVHTINKALGDMGYNEKLAIDDADFASQSLPQLLTLQVSAGGVTAQIKEADRKMLEGLEKAGFRLNWELTPGGGEVGLLGFYLARAASGSMVDMGCAQLIIDGKVKVEHGEINSYESDGVVLGDGSKLPADAVVFATGYHPPINNLTAIFGDEITNKIGQRVWGMDDEGEMMKAYRPTGQEGLWIGMGAFVFARFHSKYLALQILAQELGQSK